MFFNTSCCYVRNLIYTPTFTFQGRDGSQGAKHSNCSDSSQVGDIGCHGDIPEEIKVSAFWCFLIKVCREKQKFQLSESRFFFDSLKMKRQFYQSKKIFFMIFLKR